MRINDALVAQNAQRWLATNSANTADSIEKLSSGLRINRAGDDAAGLAISEKMRAQIRGLSMASHNSQDAISLLQIADGALGEIQNILLQMRGLAVQAASDTNQDALDRTSMNAEFSQLKLEIDSIVEKTTFNNIKLLNGSLDVQWDSIASTADDVVNVSSISITGGMPGADYRLDIVDADTNRVRLSTVLSGKLCTDELIWNGAAGATNSFSIDGATISITSKAGAGVAAQSIDAAHIVMTELGGIIQTGSDRGETLYICIGNMSAASLRVDDETVDTQGRSSSAILAVDSGIGAVSAQRAHIGAFSNRLLHKINSLDTSEEDLQSAEDRIRDIDLAKEMTKFLKNSILLQTAAAMLLQANEALKSVLQLYSSSVPMADKPAQEGMQTTLAAGESDTTKQTSQKTQQSGNAQAPSQANED